MWQNYTNAVLGLIMLVVAFASSVDSGIMWTFGILGALTFIFGLWGGIKASSEMEHIEA